MPKRKKAPRRSRQNPAEAGFGERLPSQISVGGVQRVLQNLLREMVSVRDLSTIVEAIAEASKSTQKPDYYHLQNMYARALPARSATPTRPTPVISRLSQSRPAGNKLLSKRFQAAAATTGRCPWPPAASRNLSPRYAPPLINSPHRVNCRILLTSPSIRPYVRSIVERFRASTVVLSQNEIYTKSRIKTLGASMRQLPVSSHQSSVSSYRVFIFFTGDWRLTTGD